MLKPLGDKIVVEVKKNNEQKVGSLVLATPDQTPDRGTVVAVSDGYVVSNGTRVPLAVKNGDVVIFEKFAGHKVTYLDQEYLIIKESEVLAIVE